MVLLKTVLQPQRFGADLPGKGGDGRPESQMLEKARGEHHGVAISTTSNLLLSLTFPWNFAFSH